jgi:hypothetical protein
MNEVRDLVHREEAPLKPVGAPMSILVKVQQFSGTDTFFSQLVSRVPCLHECVILGAPEISESCYGIRISFDQSVPIDQEHVSYWAWPLKIRLRGTHESTHPLMTNTIVRFLFFSRLAW